MSEPVIKPIKNGPYIVQGKVKLVDHQGNEYEVKETFALCRCGRSANKPFCDGTHARIRFRDDGTPSEEASRQKAA